MVVVMAGASNSLVGDGADAIFDGVVAVVNVLRARLPRSAITVIGMLPRKQRSMNTTVSEVNSRLLRLYSNSSVAFVDSLPAFSAADGSLLRTKFEDASMFYPSNEGYDALTDIITPYLERASGPDPPPPHPGKSHHVTKPPPTPAKNSTKHSKTTPTSARAPPAKPSKTTPKPVSKTKKVMAPPSAVKRSGDGKGEEEGMDTESLLP